MYKAGSLITLETGEYSDFTYEGPFRVLRDIDVQAVVTEFKEARGHSIGAGETAFIAWLSESGYIEDVACARWYLGASYPPRRPFAPEGYQMTAEAVVATEAAQKADKEHEEKQRRAWLAREAARRTAASFESSIWAEEAAKDKF